MFNFREIEVFRPYPNEMPEDLLWAEGYDDTEVQTCLAAEMVRVAKRGDEILALYSMASGDGRTYLLHAVVVAPGVRKQGLGRWLVGHAIGVAESKGARHVRVGSNKGSRFFRALGFVPDTEGQRFDLIPE